MIVTAVCAVGRGGGAASGDQAEVAFFVAGGVGAPVLRLLVVEGADGAHRMVVFANRSGVSIPLTVATAGGFVGRVSDFNLSFTGEEEDVGAHFLSFLRGGGNHNRGGIFEGTSIRVWVEEPSGGNRKAFGVEDSGFHVDKQPFRVPWKVAEGKPMNGELVFIRGGTERKPGRGTNRKGFVEACCQGREEGGVVSGRGRGIDTEESNRAVRIHFGGKGEGESTVRGAEDICRDAWKGGGNGVPVRVWCVDLPWSVKPPGSCREGGGSGRDRRGGRSEDGDPGRGGLSRFILGGGGYLRVGAARADGIDVSWDKLGDAGVTAIGEVGGFPRVRVGLSEGRGVPVTDVVHGVEYGEVGVESGAIIFGSDRRGGLVLGSGSDGGGLGCQGGAGGGSLYSM